jgi:hypothetical protein
LLEGEHDRFERLALAAELLGALRVVPDGGVFALRDDFLQARVLGVEVKDTS